MLKNKIEKEKLYKILEKVLIVFFIIQPVFDLRIFYNSISTLIRVCIVFILFFIYFILDKNKKKWYLIIYPIIVSIYFILHHMHALTFKSLIPGNFNYSVIKEGLYFVKMTTPFMLIYILFQAKLNKKQILDIIKYVVLIMSVSIIITNVLGISYGSYSDEKIKGNFFQWFNRNNIYSYQDLASKGWFKYANQISAVLLMFLPFCILDFLKRKQTMNFIFIIINVFALMLLSTKVAIFGIFIVFTYTILIYLLNNKINKKSWNKSSILILVGIILVYGLSTPKNPALKRIDETKLIAASTEAVDVGKELNQGKDSLINNTIVENNDNNNVAKKQSEYEEVVEYIEQNYKIKNIKEDFITVSYPYKYDPYFWQEIFNEPYAKRVDFRYLEQAMVKRVIEKNNNKFDFWFGITNTRLQNIFNIEKDFVVQYYAVGVVGLILLFSPYFLLIGKMIYIILKKRFKNIDNIQIISFISNLMMFGIAYYSGNLLNSLSFTIYFTILFYGMIQLYK